MTLPPFPVDNTTLDMLLAAIDPRSQGDDTAERSCVGDFLILMSELGGSDLDAVVSVPMMHDPRYREIDVIIALIDEVRRLRSNSAEESDQVSG